MKNYSCHVAYRRCNVCGRTSTDVKQKTCACGHFMFPIAQAYLPKTESNKMAVKS